MQPSQVVSIQYLRAVAISCAVFVHVGDAFHFQTTLGGVGVDIFFIISGFVMWLVSRQKETNPYIFIKKRLIRIVPLYWLVTVLLTISALLKPNLFPKVNPEIGHVVSSMLFIPHFSPAGNIFPLLFQGWTLNYEMFFYCVFAITLCWFRKHQFITLNIMLLGAVVMGLLVQFYAPVASTYTSAFLLEFLAGIYICRVWLDNKLLSKRNAWIVIALGIAGIAASYPIARTFPLIFFFQSQLSRALHWGIPAALIVLGAVSLESRNAIPKIRLLKMIGDASYSIYLTHYLTCRVIWIAVTERGGSLDLEVYFVTIFAIVVVGFVTHVLVEKPLSRYLSTILIPSTGLISSTGVTHEIKRKM